MDSIHLERAFPAAPNWAACEDPHPPLGIPLCCPCPTAHHRPCAAHTGAWFRGTALVGGGEVEFFRKRKSLVKTRVLVTSPEIKSFG